MGASTSTEAALNQWTETPASSCLSRGDSDICPKLSSEVQLHCPQCTRLAFPSPAGSFWGHLPGKPVRQNPSLGIRFPGGTTQDRQSLVHALGMQASVRLPCSRPGAGCWQHGEHQARGPPSQSSQASGTVRPRVVRVPRLIAHFTVSVFHTRDCGDSLPGPGAWRDEDAHSGLCGSASSFFSRGWPEAPACFVSWC